MRRPMLTLMILIACSQVGFGQKKLVDSPAEYSQPRNPSSGSYPTKNPQQSVSIDFPGGTIGDYIDLVKKDAESLNLIVTDSAKDLVLPKIALKNVPVDVAIKCIEQCFDPNETVVNVSSENRGVQIIRATMTSRKEVDVINVKRLFSDKKMTEETFMQAVEIGLAMYSQKEKLKLKIQFHKETGLLFLSGLRQEIQLVQQIVGQLQENTFGPQGMMSGMSGGSGGMGASGMRPVGMGSGGAGGNGMGAGGFPGGGDGTGRPTSRPRPAKINENVFPGRSDGGSGNPFRGRDKANSGGKGRGASEDPFGGNLGQDVPFGKGTAGRREQDNGGR